MEQWSATEDASLADGLREYSTRWGLIKAHKLPHRSVSSIRNRHQRIRKGSQGPPGRNRCQRCGQLKRGHSCTLVGNVATPDIDDHTGESAHDVFLESDECLDDVSDEFSRASSPTPDTEPEKNEQPVCDPVPLPMPPDIPTFALGNGGEGQVCVPVCNFIFEDAPRFISRASVVQELEAFIESPMISLAGV